MKTMMSFHKAVPLDPKRARHAARSAGGDERVSVGAGFMIWFVMAAFGWFGIIALLGL